MSSGVFTFLCDFAAARLVSQASHFFYDSGFAIRLFIKQFDLLYAFISKIICGWIGAVPLEVRAAAVGVVDSGGSVGPCGICGGAGAGIPLRS